LEEKEVLLREVHHRVKNNLAIISSLLSLQSSGLTDESAHEALRDSQDRVRAMALVHDQLYRSANMSNINFGAHLKELAANVASSYGGAKGGVDLTMNVVDDPLDLD
jgi:two-component sensor histidine kinase